MHIPVLLHKVVSELRVSPGEIFLDCTMGNGGHTIAVAQAAAGPIVAIGIDENEDALARAQSALARSGTPAKLWNGNFRNLDKALAENGADSADAILFDLGVSSEELLESGRGFSFAKDEPLLMTFRKSAIGGGVTAHEVVNRWSEENLATIIEGFGDELYAKRIAHAIATAREPREQWGERAPIETSRALADIVASVVPRKGKTHPATKTFQAIRMAVNDELPALAEGLQKALAALRAGGRIAVISFHSGEDRIVKMFFKESEKNGVGTTSKKPVVPSSEEVLENPRSRSAKLRIFVKNK